MNELNNDEVVCRTSPGTPGLLNIVSFAFLLELGHIFASLHSSDQQFQVYVKYSKNTEYACSYMQLFTVHGSYLQ